MTEAPKQVNVVIPMAGAGSRFAKAGYKDPKPLIDVRGKPMIQVVMENLHVKNVRFIFIVQKDHYAAYNLGERLPQLAPDCVILQTDGVTEGPACSVLLAKEYINNENPLFMANSDQYLEWNAQEFIDEMLQPGVDGGLSVFLMTAPDNKWSFAKADENGFVVDVAEKKKISDYATTGIYFWTRGKDFVRQAESMIAKNIRVNNEFYVAPVYNEALNEGQKIKISVCKKFWGLGVPEDLDFYLENFPK
eukprot:TRINITY_DN10156_c0_g1_i1.p1 TRINITY_DN10156_c0_g1~~TRINITY_DN10156_c0_g1_i1.p1  ORF type:complete len:248 (-),score=60.21 TRINITY_DN10156_c0_g1_i1:103-846(-)